jgi:hypothetical protein
MNLNYKIVLLVVGLGTVFFLLSQKHKNQNKPNQKQITEEAIIIDEKKPKIATPKVYISKPTQNGLGISNNWKSK